MIEINGAYSSAVIFADSIDNGVKGQLTALCNSPAMAGTQIRIMPDVHAGSWVVGTTIRFNDKIIPSLIGTDIGCGVLRVPIKTKGKVDCNKLDKVIRENVPSGRDIRQKAHRFSERIDLTSLKCFKHIHHEKAVLCLGSLGGGNHFIEVAENGAQKYLLIHTGSRHLGAEAAKFHQDAAFSSCNDDPPYQLAPAEGEILNDYIHDVAIIQDYARLNRLAIADEICSCMKWRPSEEPPEDTPHNYICKENGVYVLRKGAISAYENDRPTIPMNMRDGSLICRGKANDEWNCSAPHGAGRLYARSDVKNHFTLTQYKQAMNGIYSSTVSRNTLDECPMAYKPMNDIVSKIIPTVDILGIIKPIYNYKAGDE